jgi:hypothetical protein
MTTSFSGHRGGLGAPVAGATRLVQTYPSGSRAPLAELPCQRERLIRPPKTQARFSTRRPMPAPGWAATAAVVPLATGSDAYFISLTAGTIGGMTISGSYAAPSSRPPE